MTRPRSGTEEEMTPLLTPNDVANLLQISIRTVYDRARDLGGFYPAGIGVLRFSPKVLNDLMERSSKGTLAISLSVPGRELLRQGLSDAPGVRRGRSRTPKITKGTTETPLSALANASCVDILKAQALCEHNCPDYASRSGWFTMCAKRYEKLVLLRCASQEKITP